MGKEISRQVVSKGLMCAKGRSAGPIYSRDAGFGHDLVALFISWPSPQINTLLVPNLTIFLGLEKGSPTAA